MLQSELFQIYIVFHKRIYEECYREIPDEDLQRYFTFLAVNPDIEKEYPTNNKFKILKEWELEKYDHRMQRDGFRENSAIHHIWQSGVYKKYKYVGFAQYDMVISGSVVPTILDSITKSDNLCFAPYAETFKFCVESLSWHTVEAAVKDRILYDYEQYFGKPFSQTSKYPIVNTFVIPSSTFDEIMPWVTQLYYKLFPWCSSPPFYPDYGRVASVFERVMAFVVGEQPLTQVRIDIKHDNNYKNGCY